MEGFPPAFSLPPRPALVFGAGKRAELPVLALSLAGGPGARVLLLTGSSALDKNGMAADIEEGLKSAGLDILRKRISGEPQADQVDALAREAASCACIVATGGGSVLDAGKAAAAMAAAGGSVRDYLEGLGTNKHPGSRLPWIALPCTAGTGAEATTNAVISGKDDGGKPFKRSLRHPSLIPDAAILDPELCAGQGGPQAIRRAMDALSQLLEAYSSRRAGPLSDAIVLAGLDALGRGLPALIRGDADQEDWGGLLFAAHCSGIGLASAGLGLPHGLAGPLGAATGLGHAEILARVLPPCFREAVARSREAATDGGRSQADARSFLDRCSRASRALGLAKADAGDEAAVEALLDGLEKWKAASGLPAFREAGVDPSLLEALAASASKRDSLAPMDPGSARRVLGSC